MRWVHHVSSGINCSKTFTKLYRLPVRTGSLCVLSTCASYPLGKPGPNAVRKYMPELPPWLIFTSALNSQFTHFSFIQNRWLAGPSPVMAPFFTVQDSGRSFAFQPSRVEPSNIGFHSSALCRAARARVDIARKDAVLRSFMAYK